ncbi:cyclase family protein [Rubrobacter taiwanensis]|jgi:kynurenine formamidase|uniref:cyclase family protein n=1 Tax=Rubrobacter taiwanensis TaxID=185139 RepID=UPI003C74DBA1
MVRGNRDCGREHHGQRRRDNRQSLATDRAAVARIRPKQKIGHAPSPGDIVLFRTGADEHWGTEKFFERGCGLGREAVLCWWRRACG